MGINEYISSTMESVKYYTPDPLKKLCGYSYDHSRDAVVAIRDTTNQYLPPQDEIGRFAKSAVKIGAQEGIKWGMSFVPGGSILHSVSTKAIGDTKKSKQEEMEWLKAKERAYYTSEMKTLTAEIKTLRAEVDQLKRNSKSAEQVESVVAMKELKLMNCLVPLNSLFLDNSWKKKKNPKWLQFDFVHTHLPSEDSEA